MVPSDTPATMLRWQAAALRRAGGARRLAMAFELTALAREISLAGLRVRHPGLGRERLEEEYAKLVLGEDAARRWAECRRRRTGDVPRE